MNIFAILKTPDFFISKFNGFQSQKLYLFELFLLLGLILNFTANNLKLNKLSHYFYIIVLFNPYITIFQKILTITLLTQINSKQIKLINLGVKHSIYLNLIIGIFQLIKNKSLGLYKLGESNLNEIKTQVAKIKINSKQYIRAYGLLGHPNILAFLSLLNIELNHKVKNIINLITLSGSNSLSLLIKNLKQKKFLSLSLFIFLIILTIKGHQSLQARLLEITQISSHQNFQPIHNIFIDSLKTQNYLLVYGFTILIIKNFKKVYFIIPVMLLDHLIISNFACFIYFLIYTSNTQDLCKNEDS